MKYLLLLLPLFSLICNTPKVSYDDWQPLFNGKDLSGWDIKFTGFELNENYRNTFLVEDGLLKVSYDNWDRFDGEFGHMFFNKKFSSYILRAEYRFVGEQVNNGPGWAFKNNGLMLHSQSAESMLKDQDFPVSIEAQLLGGPEGTEERPTGNLCTPGTHVVMDGELFTPHCISSSSPTFRGEEWVTAEFIVHADSLIQHKINGELVLEYAKPQVGGSNKPDTYPVPDGSLLSEGYIAIQAETHPIHFRKIEIKEFDKKSP